MPQYANIDPSQLGLTHSSPIEERKALIIAKLQEERALRRQYVAEGRGNEFQVQTLPSGSLPQTYQSDAEVTLSPNSESARFGLPEMVPGEQAYQQRRPNDENLDANIAYLHQQAEDLREQNDRLAGQKAARAAMNPFLTQGNRTDHGGLGSPGQTSEFRQLADQHASQQEYPLQ